MPLIHNLDWTIGCGRPTMDASTALARDRRNPDCEVDP